MQELVRYDAMVSAIAECHRYDEVKELHSKAIALELYAKQARNTDAERKAAEVRIRAENRAGELLAELKRTPPQDARSPATVAGDSEYRQALEQTGTSERTAQRWQQLAAVPKDEFEAALRDPDKKPTTNGILARGAAPQKLNEDALWFWGRLREYEQRNYFEPDRWETDEPFHYMLDQMTDAMRADTYRLIPYMAAFFTACERAIRER